jgi:hypothetical protein
MERPPVDKPSVNLIKRIVTVIPSSAFACPGRIFFRRCRIDGHGGGLFAHIVAYRRLR